MNKLNSFLKTRAEVDICTEYLQKNNLVEHVFSCKNFDVAIICEDIKDGDLLDMGSNGSYLLHSAAKKGVLGKKCGIDLGKPEYEIEGVEYLQGDLMKTPYADNSFDTITCLSVIEHEVNYDLLAKECNRLLRPGGKLYITFDYWDPKVDTTDVGTKLYGLEWDILDKSDVLWLVSILKTNGLKITSEIDWTTQDAVINPQFYAPYGKEYTFGILCFSKD